jgi:hypothetical protein
METILTSETFVIFGTGDRRLGVNAMHVLRTSSGDSWAGQAPLVVGSLRGEVDPAQTRVLELETSDEQSVPVLTSGKMRLSTVDRSSVHEVAWNDVRDLPHEFRELVGSVVRDGSGNVPILAPDAVKRARDRLPGTATH